MPTTQDVDDYLAIKAASDFTEEARTMSGNKILIEKYSSATVGKRATLTYSYTGPKCTGHVLTVEDI